MAVYDEVAVANMALDRIGIGQPIDALSEQSDEARVCNRWYEKCRDRVLSLSRVWPFQKRRVALGLVEEDPNETWSYAYRYPVNCLLVLAIDADIRLNATPIEFELGSDDTGRLIFTDQEDAVAIYSHIYTDPGEWPDLFADAVAWCLASEIAIPLRSDAGIAANADAKFREAKANAFARAQSEGFLDRLPSSYVTARGGLVDQRFRGRYP